MLVYEGPGRGDEGTRVQEKKPLGKRMRNNSEGLEQRQSWVEGKCSLITAPPCYLTLRKWFDDITSGITLMEASTCTIHVP